MAANVFEESTLTLSAWIARGRGERATAKFVFEQKGGASTLESAELELGGKQGDKKKVTTTVTLPKCKDDEDNYTVSYKVTCNGIDYPGGELRVWLKTATFKAVDSKGDPMPGVRFTFSQTKDKEWVTNDKGECPLPINATGKPIVSVVSPCWIESWNKDKGRVREAKVERAEYKVNIAQPSLEGITKDNPHKQYVNLKAELKAPTQGSRLTVNLMADATGEGVPDAGVPGDTMYVRVEFAGDNSKRNSPAPALVAGGKTIKPDKNGVALGQVVVPEEGVPQFEVELGKAGGDRTTIKVGITEACEDATLYVENWRRVWYQLTLPKGTTAPKLDRMTAALAEVYIEYVQEGKTVEIEESDSAPKGLSWLDGAWFGGKGKLLCIGNYNRGYYHDKFNDTKTPQMVHVLCCHQQFDSERAIRLKGIPKVTKSSIVKWSDGTKVTGVRMAGRPDLLPKRLTNGKNPFRKGTWEAADGSVKGVLTSSDVHIDKTAKWNRGVVIKLPDQAVKWLAVDPKRKVSIELQLYAARGPFLGESAGHLQLIVIDQKEVGINDTLTHELGHSINQVPQVASDKPPGLAAVKHGRQYVANGHTGGHCAEGMSETNYAGGAGKAGTSYAGDFTSKSECSCVMYGADNSACTGKFCSRCRPFVLAEAIESVHPKEPGA